MSAETTMADLRNEPSGGLTSMHYCVIGAALLAPFFIYFSTVLSIVSIWNSSETFAHGYIILPISLWLVWRRRATLMQMTLQPYGPALLLLAACGLGWLLGQIGNVQIVQQYAFVAMIPAAALAILGPQIAGTIAFPLLFLLFAVPFGEIFIDPLIKVTANIAVEAVRITGIPVLRDGNTFTLPTGNWSVVEACSGIRYLISSFTLGCLYAYLTYRSFWRRALFGLVSIIVPIIANGLRAYMIVMIGHLSGMTLAVGVDHIIYGWLFFGLVMFLMFWIGSFWREDYAHLSHEDAAADGEPVPAASPATSSRSRSAVSSAKLTAAACAVIAVIGIWPIYSRHIDQASFNPAPATLSTFEAKENATAQSANWASWRPAYSPANAELRRFYDVNGHGVGLSLLYYRNQRRGAELISSSNHLVVEKDPIWHRVDTTPRVEDIGGRKLSLREVTLANSAEHPERILVWDCYWIDDRFTSNDYVGKLLQVKQKFFNGGDDGAMLMAFAPYDEKPEEARAALRTFLAQNLDGIEATLASNKRP